jgi:hypothetical protein
MVSDLIQEDRTPVHLEARMLEQFPGMFDQLDCRVALLPLMLAAKPSESSARRTAQKMCKSASRGSLLEICKGRYQCISELPFICVQQFCLVAVEEDSNVS